MLGLVCSALGMSNYAVSTNKGDPYADALYQWNRSGFFPGAVYLCSFWYMPRELTTRLAWFYCASALSGAFSGVLAAGIAEMDGVGGYEGWRWIFILEGLATVVVGVASFFLLIDTPGMSSRWLDADEIRYLELQLFIKDGGAFEETDQEINSKQNRLKDLFAVLTNWKMYGFGYILLCQTACSYGSSHKNTSIWGDTEIILSRYKVYTSHDNQGNGIQQYQRTVHDCATLCCRRHLRRMLLSTFRPLSMAHAVCRNPPCHGDSRI